MEPPQNRNNNNEGNGRANEWYNNHFFTFCKLMAIAMLYGTYFFVRNNSSKIVEKEDGLQQQAKNNENTSGNLVIYMVIVIMYTMLNHYEDELDHAIDQARQAILHYFNILIPVDISQLAMVKVGQEQVNNGAQCTTCLETFNLEEDVAKMDCQHIFHRACIVPWLQRNNTCPVCRAKVEWHRGLGRRMMEHQAAYKFLVFCILMAIAMVCLTVYCVANNSTTMEKENGPELKHEEIQEPQAKIDRNPSGWDINFNDIFMALLPRL